MKAIIENRVRVAYALTAVLAGLIAVLTLVTITAPAPGLVGDKLYHFIAFSALVFPLAFCHPPALKWLIVASIIFGAAIEIIQPYVGRQGEWADFAADVIGILAGAVAGLVGRAVVKHLRAKKLPHGG